MTKARSKLSRDIVSAIIGELEEQENLSHVLTKGEIAHLQAIVEAILTKNQIA